jgi:DNA-binding NtrC family response regulator
MPALRERRDDIEPLAEHFVKKYAEANGVAARPLAPSAVEKLRAHSWRGNVRELENAMHRAVLLAQGDTIGAEAIQLSGGLAASEGGARPTATATPPSGATAASGLVGRTVADVERDLILDTLTHCLGNRTHAANILGISIRTLRNKLKLYSEQGVPVSPAGDTDRPHL